MTTLYIDGDACPVKAEAERVATRHKVPMALVSNGGLRPSTRTRWFRSVIVAEGADEADKWIAERCGHWRCGGDIRHTIGGKMR